MKKLLNMTAHVFASTAVLVFAANFFTPGAFGVSTLLGTLALSAGLTVGAIAALFVLVAIVAMPSKLRKFGFVLQTVLGTLAGTAAISGFAFIAPALVGLTIAGAAAFALANTLLIWALGMATGTIKASQLKMWSE